MPDLRWSSSSPDRSVLLGCKQLIHILPIAISTSLGLSTPGKTISRLFTTTMVAFLPSPPLTLALLQSCWARSNSLLWPSRIVRAAQLHRCADADILAGYICFHLKTVFFRLGVRHSVGPTRWIFCDTLQSSLCVHVRHFVLAFSCFLPKFLPNSYNMNLRGKKTHLHLV